ncbi:MAG: hypothetical protein O3C21_19050 [Verrucomicrobia bacterium]|nr:hypothetical protein [Verrucomicrobiota bacterium]
MIKLRRRNCNRDFVHAECGATIHVPRIGELRNGLPLSLVAAPENIFEESVAPLPESHQTEPAIVPRDLRRSDAAANPVHYSQADLADLAAELQELTAGLAEVVTKLQEIIGPNPMTNDAARNDAQPLASEQAAHAVLVKGKADRATLKETYRPLEEVHELREDNEQALAQKKKQREKARDSMISKAAPWEMDEADPTCAGRSRNATFPWKIVIPSAAVLFIGGFSAAILSHSDNTKESPPPQSYEEVLSKIDAAPGGAEKIALIHSNIDTIKQGVNNATVSAFLDDYLAAKTWQDQLQFVRKPDRVKPLMARYYSDHALRRGTVKQVQRVAFTRSGSLAFVDVTATDNSDAPMSAALELVDGKFFLDWESFTAYSDLSLSEFLKSPPGTIASFRIKAEPSFYFNYSFNEDAHVALRIEEPLTEASCYGYVEQGSEIRKILTDMIIARQTANNRVIRPLLKLRISGEDHGDNQVWIDSLESESWVTP